MSKWKCTLIGFHDQLNEVDENNKESMQNFLIYLKEKIEELLTKTQDEYINSKLDDILIDIDYMIDIDMQNMNEEEIDNNFLTEFYNICDNFCFLD